MKITHAPNVECKCVMEAPSCGGPRPQKGTENVSDRMDMFTVQTQFVVLRHNKFVNWDALERGTENVLFNRQRERWSPTFSIYGSIGD